jgi:hypothetical protein
VEPVAGDSRTLARPDVRAGNERLEMMAMITTTISISISVTPDWVFPRKPISS